MRRIAAAFLTTCLLLGGCSSSTQRIASDTERSQLVYVVRRAHHSGVAMSIADWPNRDWPVLTGFPQARYLEFGWGDAAYYQEPNPTLGQTIAAVFWPTPTVMEVVPWKAVAQTTEDHETVALHVSSAELRAIAASIDDSFVQPVSPTGNGYRAADGQALFYHARGKFHLFRMCNRWTAELLQLAGCDVSPRLTMTASQVIRAARRCEGQVRP